MQTNPIILNGEYFGIVLLFRDITVYKKNLELFKQNQFEQIDEDEFSIKEVINKTKLFMSFELKKHNCTLVEKTKKLYST